MNWEQIEFPPKEKDITYDDFNNPVPIKKEERRVVNAKRLNVSNKEHYTLTLKSNFKRSIQFKIYNFDYFDEEYFWYNDNKYTITNTKFYNKEKNTILIVGGR